MSQDVSLSAAPAIPSSSLDFLADISANHARAENEAHPMMVDNQQGYLGWNGMVPIDQSTNREPVYDAMPDDMLQLWLEPRGGTSSHHSSMDMMRDSKLGLAGDTFSTSSDRQYRNDFDTGKSENIPNERFAKVQSVWLAPSGSAGRIMNCLWRGVAASDVDNIFEVAAMDLSSQPESPAGSRYGLNEDSRQRLSASFNQSSPHFHQSHMSTTTVPVSNSLPNFPPAEILDMSLDLYFRDFHPIMPLVHLPTFSANKTRLSLLYVMCLIGMIALDTKGTTEFVAKNFSFVLGRLTSELAQCSIGIEDPLDAISTFATVSLFLNLAVMTGEKEHLSECQMLYVNLMSIVQRHGLFAVTEGQILDAGLFDAIPGLNSRWKAWSKVESVKRIITGLIVMDSWYSSFLGTSPIICPDLVQYISPCDEALFQANSSSRWIQLVHSGKLMLTPTVMAPSEVIDIPTPGAPLEDFSMHGLLATVQLRLSQAYHRLLSNRASYPFAPCHTYAMDGRARCLPSLQCQILRKHGESLDHRNPNAVVMWHNMCMTLTADIQIFDLAAGRAGPIPARQALDDIATWSQTPAARRACLHASHIYKSMMDRKASDQTTFHSVFSLFSAALVLGLYTFMVPISDESQVGNGSIELLDDVDWHQVGTEGFTSFMEPRGSQSLGPSDNPAVNFIRNGGALYIRGIPFQGGYQSARRVLLDYAGLLKDTGKWSVRKFSYVLHIMSDVLMDVE